MWPRFSATALVVSALLLVAHCGEDYYEILGVGKDATNKEIRKAFKKLALVHHPDKSKEKDAEQLKREKKWEEKRKKYHREIEELKAKLTEKESQIKQNADSIQRQSDSMLVEERKKFEKM